MSKPVPISSVSQVDIVASFQTNYYISGIAPFGDSLAILAYIPGEEDGEKDFSNTAPPRQVFPLDGYGSLSTSWLLVSDFALLFGSLLLFF